jgi:hypothetical protein
MNKLVYGCFVVLCFSCSENANVKSKQQADFAKGTFGYDIQFLQQHDSVVVLKGDDGKSQVVVSPKYQGKVFTSTANGAEGSSFGWINYKAFTAPLDSHMNAYGGENRFWLGPEGGPFSLFFTKGAAMKFENWKTPASFDTESWTIRERSENEVRLQKNMNLINYAGTQIQLSVDRAISILRSFF